MRGDADRGGPRAPQRRDDYDKAGGGLPSPAKPPERLRGTPLESQGRGLGRARPQEARLYPVGLFFGLAVPRGDFKEPECDSWGDLKVHQE